MYNRFQIPGYKFGTSKQEIISFKLSSVELLFINWKKLLNSKKKKQRPPSNLL